MHFQDEGIIVNKIKYGDNDLILSIFTQNHGLQKGFIKGAFKSKQKFLLEQGNICLVEKKNRTESQLGYFKLEFSNSILGTIFNNKIKLLMLETICIFLNNFLGEKETDTDFYNITKSVILLLEHEGYLYNYVNWEKLLLEKVGYGLDLSKCAVSGVSDNLYYLSPKTGKSVTYEVGKSYHNKLFIIPKSFKNNKINDIPLQDIKNALEITGYFLKKFSHEYVKPIPNSRSLFINSL